MAKKSIYACCVVETKLAVFGLITAIPAFHCVGVMESAVSHSIQQMPAQNLRPNKQQKNGRAKVFAANGRPEQKMASFYWFFFRLPVERYSYKWLLFVACIFPFVIQRPRYVHPIEMNTNWLRGKNRNDRRLRGLCVRQSSGQKKAAPQFRPHHGDVIYSRANADVDGERWGRCIARMENAIRA